MAEIANRHALGVPVIDEIQHLMEARGAGRDEMLNLLVTLVNHCSTPVMLIGTRKAPPLLQGAFRQARRAGGLGGIDWDRMPRGRTRDRPSPSSGSVSGAARKARSPARSARFSMTRARASSTW